MSDNPLSASRLHPDDPFFRADGAQYVDRPSHRTEFALNSATGNSPQILGNLHWGLVSPPIAAGQFPQTYDDQGGWGLRASPPRGVGLTQMSNNRESNLVNLPSRREYVNASQPDSVKHLTCWYWANKGCKLPEHACLYSHYDTGRLAEPPVQVQRGRPAVAGKNATNSQPVYKDWKGRQRAQSGVIGPQNPQIQRQIERFHAKAAQRSDPIPVIAEQSGSADMVKEEYGFAEPAVNFNHPHPNDHLSSPPADSYRNLSIGIGASSQPFHQQLSQPPQQTGGSFTASGPTAHYAGVGDHYGMGSNYGSMGGNHGGLGGGYGGMGGNITNYDPHPHHIGDNTPSNLNASAPSGQPDGQAGIDFWEMQKKMKVKDKVITELAGIIEMLEINYGISIDDQNETLEKLMGIARSLEEEAREGGNAASAGKGKGRASNAPAPSTSNPQYGKPPAHHERLMAAMKGSTNLVQMEKMTLSNSKARKRAVGGQLESIKAAKLLPRGWMER